MLSGIICSVTDFNHLALIISREVHETWDLINTTKVICLQELKFYCGVECMDEKFKFKPILNHSNPLLR